MAEEAYIVAYDIQNDNPGLTLKPEEKLGAKEEVKIGYNGFETAGSSLFSQGIRGVATAKLVEVFAGSAAEAAEVVRAKYATASNTSAVRAVVKPNTNFKVIT